MRPLRFVIERWAAWAPGVETAAEWAAWSAGERALAESDAKPDVRFLPALLRRRASRVSRAALWAAHHCGADEADWPTVFGSRHGELHRSFELMSAIAAEEPLSPNAFSLSVHNTVSGLYTIAAGNRAPSSALAAGRDTLAAGMIEALGYLHAGSPRVLLVDADERTPAFYRSWVPAGPPVFAVALVLRQPREDEAAWQLTRTSEKPRETGMQPSESAVDIMHLLAGQHDRLDIAGERYTWSWQRG